MSMWMVFSPVAIHHLCFLLIGHHHTGFDKAGRPTNYSGPGAIKYKSIKEVVCASSKVITLVDLAGHEKYIRTTGACVLVCAHLLATAMAHFFMSSMAHRHESPLPPPLPAFVLP
jgi:hypothetical protein